MRSLEPPCAVCSRPSRGFGWFDPAPRRQPRPSACFCSLPCQGFWARRAAQEAPAVVDLTEQEQAAIRAATRCVAEAMGEIGWATRFQDLTEPQVLTLIEVAVGAFQEAMQAIARGQPAEVPL
jgi:Family of unknown function (DUF6511)